MKDKEFDNLNSEDSEFQKKVIKFVLATYEKYKKHLPPSLFVKSAAENQASTLFFLILFKIDSIDFASP